MGLCPYPSNSFDFSNACVRETWGTLVPLSLVVLFSVWSLPVHDVLPENMKSIWKGVKEKSPFRTYLTLSEAEGLLGESKGEGEEEGGETRREDVEVEVVAVIPLWRAIIFGFIGTIELASWISLGSYRLISSQTFNTWSILRPFLEAFVWMYTVSRPILRPTATVPWDLFVVYAVQLVGGLLGLGGVVYDVAVGQGEWNGVKWVLAGNTLNVLAVISVIAVVFGMPLAVPSRRVDKKQIGRSISPEDYTTLWGWATFSWVYPLVRRGKYTTMQESDVWSLSPTIQSRPIFIKFSRIQRKTLLRRLWAANSLDLCLDASLTMLSICFGYLNPYFLNHILSSISPPSASPSVPASTPPTTHSSPDLTNAYIYAVLMFTASVIKAQCDLQHLWFGRRASTRVRSELMAAIYDKALKRKDFSGVVQGTGKEAEKKEAEGDGADGGTGEDGEMNNGVGNGKDHKDAQKKRKKEKSNKKKKEKEKDKGDEPKAGADVGKIVNLMAGDANRISQVISGLYFIYGAPLEIIIGCTYLYQLLGLSAFAGFITLLLGWPLNTFLAKRSIRINKGTLAARDKRMGVVSEVVGGVKFIKFFAWEERWIERVMEARGGEMKWMVKARINSVMFSMLWMSAPILVSIISFWAYVVQGNELTISTAFTAIALFNMIRAPLNVIPTWIVQILQTKVALDRIAVYLDEEEVDEKVSSLKRDLHSRKFSEDGDGGEVLPGAEDDDVAAAEGKGGLGLLGATLKWNEVEEKDKDAAKENGHTSSTISAPSSNGHGNGNTSHDAEPSETGAGPSVASSPDSQSLAMDADTDHKFELRDISVVFPEGQLTVITGPTASGKTALLMAILGEMTLLSGQILLTKDLSKIDEHGNMQSISYSAQSPWLRHQSIRDNILFGYPFDEARYKEVVEACALLPDFEMLEDGDRTEIGARGVSLSGGQKARVALARAVYARTKYVLLDDPLSAVDSHTSRYLYEKLLCGPLLQNRTVVLITHHVDLVLPGAYYLVRMLDGRIDTQGTVKDLRAQGVLTDIVQEAEVDARQEEMAVAAAAAKDAEAEGDAEVIAVEGEGETDEEKKPRKLVKEEHREEGGVKWAIYKKYLKASSYWIWSLLAFLVVVNQILGVSEKLWIKTWGQAYEGNENFSASMHSSSFFKSFSPFRISATPEHELSMDAYVVSQEYVVHHAHTATTSGVSVMGININWPNASEHPLFYVGIYAAIGLTNVLVNVLAITAQYTGALRASRVLFKQLLVTVVRATFRFHDTTPQGRMLNRFGKDIETIDSSLASSLQAVNSSLASFFASIVTVAFVFPLFLLPAAVIGAIYRELAIGYLNTGRDLRRMESNSRSPIFSDFAEILEGIVTVRAFSVEKRFLDNLHKKIDTTTKMWYGFWMTNRWLLLNFDILGSTAVLITALFSISKEDAGWAGLCISSALSFTGSVYWACRFWTGLELDLNSVERIVEYLDLPQEPPAIIESNRPPAYWPSASRNDALISVENLVIKYAPELPPVLQDVSFSLKAGERIGLLGRTGSGKSTLAMSILRFVDPTSGRIVIDGIDISTIGIHDLRSRLTFIPQDATLFSGTLRDNLDPFGEHTDAECLDVLYRVQMISHSQSASRGTSRAASTVVSPDSSRPPSIHGVERESTFSSIGSVTTDVETKTTVSLDTQVSAGGTNFSQGQRQLIAMARALLRRSSIIVLDEATSSIDFATDAKIQATIREEFTDSLLLTIAHRLRTIIDYDRLIVLDKGRVVEFDTPLNLIQKEGGVFRTMCLKSGTFAELEASARAKAEGGDKHF